MPNDTEVTIKLPISIAVYTHTDSALLVYKSCCKSTTFGNISTKKSGSNSAIQQTEQNKITKLNNNNNNKKNRKIKTGSLGMKARCS